MIRVLIADDHAVVRQGLRTFLDLQADIDVVGEAADGEEAVAVAAEHAPDVILLDLVMPRLDGIGALRRLRETAPAARVIVLTSFGEDERLFTALRAGASGYLLKDVEPAELVRSIRTVHTGGAPLSPAVAARVVEELASGGGAGRAAADDLTPRELEVLCLIARGLFEQADRARAGRGGEDGQDPRLPRAGQAGALRPHAGGAVRGAGRAGQPRVLGPIPDGGEGVRRLACLACRPPSSPAPPAASGSRSRGPSPSAAGGS